jgi:hypothetical protein
MLDPEAEVVRVALDDLMAVSAGVFSLSLSDAAAPLGRKRAKRGKKNCGYE